MPGAPNVEYARGVESSPAIASLANEPVVDRESSIGIAIESSIDRSVAFDSVEGPADAAGVVNASTSHDSRADRSVVSGAAANVGVSCSSVAVGTSPSAGRAATYSGCQSATSRAGISVIVPGLPLVVAHAGSSCAPIASSRVSGDSKPARYVAPSPPPSRARTSNVGAEASGNIWRNAGANGDAPSCAESPAPGAVGTACATRSAIDSRPSPAIAIESGIGAPGAALRVRAAAAEIALNTSSGVSALSS